RGGDGGNKGMKARVPTRRFIVPPAFTSESSHVESSFTTRHGQTRRVSNDGHFGDPREHFPARRQAPRSDIARGALPASRAGPSTARRELVLPQLMSGRLIDVFPVRTSCRRTRMIRMASNGLCSRFSNLRSRQGCDASFVESGTHWHSGESPRRTPLDLGSPAHTRY